MKLKLSWRIWVLIFFLVFSILSISPNFFTKGVVIESVTRNSTAFNEGLRDSQIITKINGLPVNNLNDYNSLISEIFPANEKIKTTILTNSGEFVLFDNQQPNITVSNIPRTRIKTGLDLQGGARALVKAKNKTLSPSETQDLIDITNNRLNVYGISDVSVTSVSDLEGSNFMLVEVAGATPADIEQLIAQQGKFEAKIGNETVFVGGSEDITSVCRNDAQCSGIESCSEVQGGYACNFRFVIYLSGAAAQKHADITSKLDIEGSGTERYLSKPLDLYVDGQLVDSLKISEGLKGRATTQIQIQGSGQGTTRDEAIKDTDTSMKKLQTILITGGLPYQLEIVKLDTISPKLGESFIFSILLTGVVAVLLIALFIFIRYRKIKQSLAVMFTSLSEILIILGFAAFLKWNLDLSSIAGILGAIGTGVDQQIVILDESIQKTSLTLKQKMKHALFILIATYLTAVVALLPVMVAGAGLLRGFAFTTILGMTIGILITRPAFADMIKRMGE